MIIKRPVGEKGQIVIPKDIREMLGLRAGENVVFEVVQDEIMIKKDEEDVNNILQDFLNVPGKKKKKSSIKELKKIIYEQYDEEIP